MNERFLSRGKRKDNGNWETGFLVIKRYDCSDEQYFITDKMTGYHTPVIPETVGQCTGLKDKNGKLIFEGDIVKDSDSGLFGEVIFATAADGFDGMTGFMVDDVDDGFQNYNGFWLLVKIIGNIHDNPELLQRSDEL